MVPDIRDADPGGDISDPDPITEKNIRIQIYTISSRNPESENGKIMLENTLLKESLISKGHWIWIFRLRLESKLILDPAQKPGFESTTQPNISKDKQKDRWLILHIILTR